MKATQVLAHWCTPFLASDIARSVQSVLRMTFGQIGSNFGIWQHRNASFLDSDSVLRATLG